MPTYEYSCPAGHEFEVFQKMSDDPVASCPECGKEASRKISGGAGFLFKGEGFYATDYRSEEYKKKASSEKKTAGGGPSEAAGSAEKGGSGGDGPASGSAGSSASDG